MIFVDTNYFLRFLLKDKQEHYLKAKNLFSKASREEVELVTSTVVFFEVTWVLKSTYKKDKVILINTLGKFLGLNVEIGERQLLVDSLRLFSQTNLSLEDCYNFVFAKANQTVSFATFDVRLKKEFLKKP